MLLFVALDAKLCVEHVLRSFNIFNLELEHTGLFVTFGALDSGSVILVREHYRILCRSGNVTLGKVDHL